MKGQNNKIRILVDPALQPLLPKYLESRKKDLLNLRQAFDKNDFEFIRKTSHTIRGNGASYGFVRLTEICKLMEEAALNKNTQLIKSLLEEFDDYIHSVELP